MHQPCLDDPLQMSDAEFCHQESFLLMTQLIFGPSLVFDASFT